MRTTCKWLQHLTHINAGSGSSLALAGVNIWLPLCSLSTGCRALESCIAGWFAGASVRH